MTTFGGSPRLARGQGDESTTAWRTLYGDSWRVLLILLPLLLVVRGTLEPLVDPDLPMHLAIGEWIVRHRAVPFVEPFAWTRTGAPFYAYSWAFDVAIFWIAEIFGKLGLRLVHGLTMAGAFLSMIALGRAARWDPRTSLFMGIINITILDIVVASVRPQSLLFVIVPLSWALVWSILESQAPRWKLISLFLLSAFAANVHIFFPLLATPWLLFAEYSRDRRRQMLMIVGATVIGWLLSPYALTWLDVFTSSGQSNSLLTYPSPIDEAQPGFLAISRHPLIAPLAIFLAALPLIVPSELQSRRRRLTFGIAWLLGLIAFATIARLILLWWMAILPLAGWAVGAIVRTLMASEKQSLRLWRITAVWAVCSLFFLTTTPFELRAWNQEDPVSGRRLSPVSENGLDQLASWLECNARRNSGGRVFTAFGIGSALTWRLPEFSMSIDGRTIFPDSVVAPELYYKPIVAPLKSGPWRSADLAILVMPTAISDLLDQAPGWSRAAVVHREGGRIGLWVKDAWWQRAGITPLGARPVSLMPANEKSDSRGCARPVPSDGRMP
jgi:hypothetical protein